MMNQSSILEISRATTALDAVISSDGIGPIATIKPESEAYCGNFDAQATI